MGLNYVTKIMGDLFIDGKENHKWNSNMNFLLAMIGSAVGLGNIWRFPYVAYTNGGGAIILPYIISILSLGIPMLFFEYGTGYKFKSSISKTLRSINKKYEYVGWFMLTSLFYIMSYYCTVISWDIIYIPLSFFDGWGSNPNNFFNNVVLEASNSGGLFHIAIYVLIATIIVWFLMWYISHKDLNEGIGKFSKIFIPLLFIMMLVIVIFAVTLPGAMLGVSTLLTPQLSALTDVHVWLAAFGQILFSLSVGMTINIAYSSYLPDGTNIPKNAIIVAISNCSFEIYTAIGVFAILGFMSTTSGIPIDQLVTQGTGLAFIAFPQIFNLMGIAGDIIGPLFFLCIFFAGISSNISVMEPIRLAISEKFNLTRTRSVTIMCIAGGLVSLLFATSLGATLLGIFDTFANNFGIVLNVILEIIFIGWIYGIEGILPGINQSATFLKLGHKWKILVKYILPVIVTIIWITGLITNIITGDTLTTTVELILLIGLIIIPYIMTKLPAKNENY